MATKALPLLTLQCLGGPKIFPKRNRNRRGWDLLFRLELVLSLLFCEDFGDLDKRHQAETESHDPCANKYAPNHSHRGRIPRQGSSIWRRKQSLHELR